MRSSKLICIKPRNAKLCFIEFNIRIRARTEYEPTSDHIRLFSIQFVPKIRAIGSKFSKNFNIWICIYEI